MKRFIVVALLSFASLVAAQTATLSGTLTDSDGQTWNNATWTAHLVNPTGGNVINFCSGNGTPVTLDKRGTLSSGGVFSGTIDSNDCIAPSGTQWQFTIQSQTSAPPSVLSAVTLTNGQNFNAGTWASALITAPRFAAGPQTYGYNDTEVLTPVTNGSIYYNTVNSVSKQFINNAWTVFGSGNFVPITGGTMTGNLIGPGATFNAPDVHTGNVWTALSLNMNSYSDSPSPQLATLSCTTYATPSICYSLVVSVTDASASGNSHEIVAINTHVVTANTPGSTNVFAIANSLYVAPGLWPGGIIRNEEGANTGQVQNSFWSMPGVAVTGIFLETQGFSTTSSSYSQTIVVESRDTAANSYALHKTQLFTDPSGNWIMNPDSTFTTNNEVQVLAFALEVLPNCQITGTNTCNSGELKLSAVNNGVQSGVSFWYVQPNGQLILSQPNSTYSEIHLPAQVATSSNNFNGPTVGYGADGWLGSSAAFLVWNVGNVLNATGTVNDTQLRFTPPTNVPVGSSVDIAFFNAFPADATHDYNSDKLQLLAPYWNGSASALETITAQWQWSTTGANPNGVYNITATGSSGTTALAFNGTAGVTCSGSPTASFASTGGLVTHC